MFVCVFVCFFLILTLSEVVSEAIFGVKVKKVIMYVPSVGMSGRGAPTLLHTLWLPLVEAGLA